MVQLAVTELPHQERAVLGALVVHWQRVVQASEASMVDWKVSTAAALWQVFDLMLTGCGARRGHRTDGSSSREVECTT